MKVILKKILPVILTKLNAAQFNWMYSPNSSMINDDVCPPGQDLKIYLRVTGNLVFTKQ